MNSTVVGTLIGGLLLFLSSLLVPVISKRLNKATDAASSAEKLGTTAVNLVTKLESRLEKTEGECTACQLKLAGLEVQVVKERLERQKERDQERVERAAMYDAMARVIPLLQADAEQTAALQVAMRTARGQRGQDG